MDGMIRTAGDGSKVVQILIMTRDRERCGNPWSPTSAGARHCDDIINGKHFHEYSTVSKFIGTVVRFTLFRFS